MAVITRQHMEALGETGAGITHAEEVDLSRDNAFTNKWSEFCFYQDLARSHTFF
jgi:hypothetical protein